MFLAVGPKIAVLTKKLEEKKGNFVECIILKKKHLFVQFGHSQGFQNITCTIKLNSVLYSSSWYFLFIRSSFEKDKKINVSFYALVMKLLDFSKLNIKPEDNNAIIIIFRFWNLRNNQRGAQEPKLILVIAHSPKLPHESEQNAKYRMYLP